MKLLGVIIHNKSIDMLVSEAVTAIQNKSKIIFSCANPHSLVVAQNDSIFMESLNRSDQVVADGVGIIWMSRLGLCNQVERVTGHDYYCSVMDMLNCKGGSVLFFGSSPHVLNLIENKVSDKYPNIRIAGMISPPYREWSGDENSEMINKINSLKPDVLWVGMTAPKQEKWVYLNKDRLEAPVIGSIGAVFDFVAGTYPRAPKWMVKMGLEWLYRLIKEPKRMWKRNFISTPMFIYFVFKRKFFE